jgi:hypothetical protein
MSCHSCSRKLSAFTLKELETVREAQKLLGVPTIGRGVSVQEVMVEGVKEVKYAPKPPRMYTNREKRGGFPHFLT